ncbi:MAG: hypothetical protein K2P30_02135 [Lachnospiraceae bacterium]|nr:hypothetical protein [Lachnospiraceae bacterium]
MGAIEIVLIILGIVVFVVSFLLPAGKTGSVQSTASVSEEDIHNMLEKEVTGVREHISEIADETITYSMEKTERSMERLTNEKMMAINEYSDTVLSEINKNHKEVVFLYDMLNDKHENLLSTVSEASKTASEIKQAVCDVEISAKEAQEKVRAVQESVSEVMNLTRDRAAEREAAAVNFTSMPKEAAKDGFQPIMPQRIETPEEEPETGAAESGFGGAEGSGDLERQKRRNKKPKNVKRDEKEEGAAGEGAVIGRMPVSMAEVPEIAVAARTADQGGRNNNERILELHRAGKSNMAIAKELGLGIGEVKLVIDLFEGI